MKSEAPALHLSTSVGTPTSQNNSARFDIESDSAKLPESTQPIYQQRLVVNKLAFFSLLALVVGLLAGIIVVATNSNGNDASANNEGSVLQLEQLQQQVNAYAVSATPADLSELSDTVALAASAKLPSPTVSESDVNACAALTPEQFASSSVCQNASVVTGIHLSKKHGTVVKRAGKDQCLGNENCVNKCNKLFGATQYFGAYTEEGTETTIEVSNTDELMACYAGCDFCGHQINSTCLPPQYCIAECKNTDWSDVPMLQEYIDFASFNTTPHALVKSVIEPDKACIFGCTISLCQGICNPEPAFAAEKFPQSKPSTFQWLTQKPGTSGNDRSDYTSDYDATNPPASVVSPNLLTQDPGKPFCRLSQKDIYADKTKDAAGDTLGTIQRVLPSLRIPQHTEFSGPNAVCCVAGYNVVNYIGGSPYESLIDMSIPLPVHATPVDFLAPKKSHKCVTPEQQKQAVAEAKLSLSNAEKNCKPHCKKPFWTKRIEGYKARVAALEDPRVVGLENAGLGSFETVGCSNFDRVMDVAYRSCFTHGGYRGFQSRHPTEPNCITGQCNLSEASNANAEINAESSSEIFNRVLTAYKTFQCEENFEKYFDKSNTFGADNTGVN